VEKAQTQMQPQNSSNKAFRELTDSTKIEQHKEKAILTANVPLELVKQLTSSTSSAQP
jgi:hypothetical protein